MLRPVICFDMDGTLVGNDSKIHPPDKALLANHGKHNFFVTTGRPLKSVRKTFQFNHLFMKLPIPFGMVLLNGSLLYQPGEIFNAYTAFDKRNQKQLFMRVNDFPAITFLFLDIKDIYIINPTPFGFRSCHRFDFEVKKFTGKVGDYHFSKLMCISEHPDQLQKFAQTASDLNLEGVYSLTTVFEITPKEVNKGVGLQKLIGAMNLKPGLVVAVGDGENDLPLFDKADISYAPSTSPDSIKRVADRIIDSQSTGILEPILNDIDNISPNVKDYRNEDYLF